MSKLEISKNFVNQIKILHYDIFIAILGFVNNNFETKRILINHFQIFL